MLTSPLELDPYLSVELPGQIQLNALVGIGSMGRVYRAFQAGVDRDVAVKVLHRELTGNAELVARFHREAKIASRLVHPNVVQVLMTGTLASGAEGRIGGEVYLVMEFLDGISLLSALAAQGEGGALPLARTLHIAAQLSDAVGEAHAHGIVHRDLKPENIMLVRRGEDLDFVKVLDFGIARLDCAMDKSSTQAGLIFGTAKYISPEGAEGKHVGPQADVYAIATVLYQMLAGRTPFEGDSPMALLVQQIHATPPDLRTIPRAAYVPEPIAQVVMGNLAKNPADRAENARAFGRELLLAAREAGITVDTSHGLPRGDLRISSKQRTRQHEFTPELKAKISSIATPAEPSAVPQRPQTTRLGIAPAAPTVAAGEVAVDDSTTDLNGESVQSLLGDFPSRPGTTYEELDERASDVELLSSPPVPPGPTSSRMLAPAKPAGSTPTGKSPVSRSAPGVAPSEPALQLEPVAPVPARASSPGIALNGGANGSHAAGSVRPTSSPAIAVPPIPPISNAGTRSLRAQPSRPGATILSDEESKPSDVTRSERPPALPAGMSRPGGTQVAEPGDTIHGMLDDGPGRVPSSLRPGPTIPGSPLEDAHRARIPNPPQPSQPGLAVSSPPANDTAVSSRRSRWRFLAAAGVLLVALPVVALGGVRLFGDKGATTTSFDADLQEAQDAMERRAWDSPPDHNVRDLTDRLLERSPGDRRVLTLRRTAAEGIVNDALARKYEGDNVEALRLARLALVFAPDLSTAQGLVDELERAGVVVPTATGTVPQATASAKVSSRPVKSTIIPSSSAPPSALSSGKPQPTTSASAKASATTRPTTEPTTSATTEPAPTGSSRPWM